VSSTLEGIPTSTTSSSSESLGQDDFHDPSGTDYTTTCSTILGSVVPVVHLPKKKRPYKSSLEYAKQSKKAYKINGKHFARTSVISPGSTSPAYSLSSGEEDFNRQQQQPRLFLDLTVPSRDTPPTLESWSRKMKTPNRRTLHIDDYADRDAASQDILAGCNALLSISTTKETVSPSF
jgi:hypothetical protein